MKQKVISVVTIVRNGAEHIEQAMQSVINQTYNNFEYIIIDGASTDGTVQLIEKYKYNLSKFISEPDTGISNAINKSLQYIKGDFVAFLSCDNYLQPDALASLVEGITEQSKVVYANFLFVDVKSGKSRSYTTNANFLPQRMSVCPEALIINTEVLKGYGGYNESKVVAADHYLFLQTYRDYGIASFSHVDKQVLVYRSGGLAESRMYLGNIETMKNKIELGYGNIRARLEFCYFYTRLLIGSFLRRFGFLK